MKRDFINKWFSPVDKNNTIAPPTPTHTKNQQKQSDTIKVEVIQNLEDTLNTSDKN
jgi:hypothetical protein